MRRCAIFSFRFAAIMACAAPPGTVHTAPVLAPASVSRLSGQATEVRPGVWEVSMGEAVSAWVLATGPEAVTNYKLLTVAPMGRLCTEKNL